MYLADITSSVHSSLYFTVLYMSSPSNTTNIPFLFPFSVVLLDTTAVLGELGWKTFPLNGVSHSPFWFYCLEFGILTLLKWMAIIPEWMILQYGLVGKILVILRTRPACGIKGNNRCNNDLSAHYYALLWLFCLKVHHILKSHSNCYTSWSYILKILIFVAMFMNTLFL